MCFDMLLMNLVIPYQEPIPFAYLFISIQSARWFYKITVTFNVIDSVHGIYLYQFIIGKGLSANGTSYLSIDGHI